MFQIQNRYQDSGWENLDGQLFHAVADAIARAAEFSKDAIIYGMTRVICEETGGVVICFSAGGDKATSPWDNWGLETSSGVIAIPGTAPRSTSAPKVVQTQSALDVFSLLDKETLQRLGRIIRAIDPERFKEILKLVEIKDGDKIRDK